MRHFEDYERQAHHLVERRLPLPAYDMALKANHSFNLLDARGAISVTERAAYIGRVRNIVRAVAQIYLELQQEEGEHAAAAV
jgi:glycyl-tRNA synthetase alpha chain